MWLHNLANGHILGPVKEDELCFKHTEYLFFIHYRFYSSEFPLYSDRNLLYI
jgi:hypothetical protein